MTWIVLRFADLADKNLKIQRYLRAIIIESDTETYCFVKSFYHQQMRE